MLRPAAGVARFGRWLARQCIANDGSHPGLLIALSAPGVPRRALGLDSPGPTELHDIEPARAAIRRACGTVRRIDPRYAAGRLDVVKVGRSWRVEAERPTWDTWRAQRDEQARVRAIVRDALAGRPAPKSSSSD